MLYNFLWVVIGSGEEKKTETKTRSEHTFDDLSFSSNSHPLIHSCVTNITTTTKKKV